MLLDSTFLIHLEKERKTGRYGPASQFLDRCNKNEILRISIISAGEFYAGTIHPADAVRFLNNFRRLPVNEQLAREAGRLDREQRAKGKRLGENDNWIVATARLHRMTLVTNERHFAGVRGLKIVRYSTL
ncbi:MAG TPA: type II toxin-antitoxin system VapC family toxin [Verrucomicrobiae bacterium]